MHFLQGRIKAEQRPINEQKNILISQATESHCISQHAEREFWIKHTQYSAAQLLKDERLAERYMGGWIYVIRLTVDDYHRYCYVADGRKSRQRKIRGVLHTVNPVANDYYPIYKMNRGNTSSKDKGARNNPSYGSRSFDGWENQ